MKKILYFSHVNWSWIKQRPHFIAEGLSESYEVLYYGGINYLKANNAWEDSLTKVRIKSYFRFPNKIKKFSRLFYFLDRIVCKLQFHFVTHQFKPDLIWVTSPEVSHYIPSSHFNKIVFDCMDDYSLMASDQMLKEMIESNLNYLVKNCKLVFTSSSKLHNKLSKISCKDVVLINNAASDTFQKNVLHDFKLLKSTDGFYWAVYVGTISKWFDFESLIYLLDNITNLKIALYGPKDVNIPKNENLVYRGVIKHSLISSILNEFNFYLMPFKLNDLVFSVDPVKIYEYLNFNGIVVSIDYPELKKFSGLITTYKNKYELVELFNKLLRNEFIVDIKTKKNFNINNTWSIRTKEIINTLNNI